MPESSLKKNEKRFKIINTMAVKKKVPENLKSLRKAVEEIVHGEGAVDPARNLAKLAVGRDCRRIDSPLVEFVRKKFDEVLEGTGDGSITPDEQNWLYDHVTNSGLYETGRVTVEVAAHANRELMKYLHPTRSERGLQVSSEGSNRGSVKPLTAKEVDLFKEKFDAVF